jgi:hypothetical protein
MKTKTGVKAIVLLGGGRITNALVAGLRLAKYDKPLLVHDRNPGKLRQLKKQSAVAVEPSLQRAVEQARLLIIAVRPDSVSDLLLAIDELKKEKPRRPLICWSVWPLASRFQNCERDCRRLHVGHEPCPVLCAAAGADSRL